MEPWRCNINWRVVNIGSSGLGRKLNLNVETSDPVNFNLTSTMLDLYHVVKNNWTEDFYSDNPTHDVYHPKHRNSGVMSPDEASPSLRRRTLYVPFALKNETGYLYCDISGIAVVEFES